MNIARTKRMTGIAATMIPISLSMGDSFLPGEW
jgi:hypothetical protein